MKILYAPWRADYSSSSGATKKVNAGQDECVFCQQLADNQDDTHFIIKRYKHVVLLMNRYPYNAGHSMLLPLEHKANLDSLNQETRAEFIEVLSHSVSSMQKILGADGMNVGLNLGKAAGGSITSHLHMHIVPRWQGDTNFMSVVGETQVISFNMRDIFLKLKKEL